MESLSTKVNSRRGLLTLVLGTCLLIGCIDTRSQECQGFLALSSSLRQAEFQKHTLKKQTDLCLCALKQEPPDLELADQLSDRGEEAIPLLIEKLKSTTNEADQHDVIYIFELMSRKGHLKGRSQLITDISIVVEEMTIPQVKEDAAEILKRIQLNTGVKAVTYVH